MPFTLPADTQAPGLGDPAGDINKIVDALVDMGATASITNKAYAGGADPTGQADSSAAINTAASTVPAGTVLTGPPGVYRLGSGLSIPSKTGLAVAGGGIFPAPAGLVLKPSASFAGPAVISPGSGAYLGGIAVDGSLLPAGSVTAIQGGTAVGVILDKVYVYKPTGIGLDVSGGARGWHCRAVKVDSSGAQGVACSGHSDGVFDDVHVIGSVGHCWSIAGSVANSKFIGCKAEWSGAGKDGWHLAGTWQSGTGSGQVQFTGCSSDRCDNNGMQINVTGNSPILLAGCSFRRDGRNAGAGGGSFAGLNVLSTTAPVIVNGLTVFPGVDDDGTQANSPANGFFISGTNTLVQLNGAVLHGASAGIGGSGTGASYRNVWTRTGSTSSPTAPVLTADTA